MPIPTFNPQDKEYICNQCGNYFENEWTITEGDESIYVSPCCKTDNYETTNNKQAYNSYPKQLLGSSDDNNGRREENI